jgi:hypothetical protein
MTYKIEFYVPSEHAERVKDAMFAAGAGQWGNYSRCAWQAEGVGQFRPLKESRPHIGSTGRTEQVSEYKVEMICDAAAIDEAIQALTATHPYETPAFSYWPIEISERPTGSESRIEPIIRRRYGRVQAPAVRRGRPNRRLDRR